MSVAAGVCSRWRWQRLAPANLGWPRSTRAATTASRGGRGWCGSAALNARGYVARASSFAAARGGHGLYGYNCGITRWLRTDLPPSHWLSIFSAPLRLRG